MPLEIKSLEGLERLYAERQSMQLSMQTGFIGELRMDINNNNTAAMSTWNTFSPDKNTPEFKQDMESVLLSMRSKTTPDGILENRNTMEAFCAMHPEDKLSSVLLDYEQKNHYGLRTDTDKYSYIFRMTPQVSIDNCSVYAYLRNSLDTHLEQSRHGIRFIDPHYRTLFMLQDGDRIRVTRKDTGHREYVCRYIDPYHFEIQNENHYRNVYHICEFAERMQEYGNQVIPLRSSLPEQCYNILPSTGEIIITKKGEQGYYRTDFSYSDIEENKKLVDAYNRGAGVNKAQTSAMLAGSMFGWGVSAADPKEYDENGMIRKGKIKGMEISI